MNENILLGRLISSDSRQYTFGCADTVMLLPQIGGMVMADLQPEMSCFGVICDFRWNPDELIGQLARTGTETIDQGVLLDNQIQRVGGPLILVQMVGYRRESLVQALPPQPPITLEKIYICGQEEVISFTRHSFVYLRLLLEARATPICDVIASHLHLGHIAHLAMGDPQFIQRAMRYLTGLLLGDYDTLVAISEALSQKISDECFGEGLTDDFDS